MMVLIAMEEELEGIHHVGYKCRLAQFIQLLLEVGAQPQEEVVIQMVDPLYYVHPLLLEVAVEEVPLLIVLVLN